MLKTWGMRTEGGSGPGGGSSGSGPRGRVIGSGPRGGVVQEEGSLGVVQEEGSLGVVQEEGPLGVVQEEGSLGVVQEEGSIGSGPGGGVQWEWSRRSGLEAGWQGRDWGVVCNDSKQYCHQLHSHSSLN